MPWKLHGICVQSMNLICLRHFPVHCYGGTSQAASPSTLVILVSRLCLPILLLLLQQASCLVNPRAGYETSLNLKPVAIHKRRRIAVVGSGPAGLAAATGCAERGHLVTLFEGSRQVGGQVQTPPSPYHP